jgi:hypothetical protein
MQISLLAPDNSSLQSWDSRDQLRQYKGRYDKSKGLISFDDGTICRRENEQLSCDINDSSVVISPVTPEEISLASLQGDYQLLDSQQQRWSATIEANGEITASMDDCTVSGHIKLSSISEPASLAITLAASDCAAAQGQGIVISDSVNTENDTLQVYVADSVLSGFWFK